MKLKINICTIGFLFILSFQACSSTRQIKEMTIRNPDLNAIQSGTYYGESGNKWVSAAVEIVMEDQKIKSLKLVKHETGLGKKAESIIDSVMLKQSLDVDVISGATISSKTILKSIENALNTGQKVNP